MSLNLCKSSGQNTSPCEICCNSDVECSSTFGPCGEATWELSGSTILINDTDYKQFFTCVVAFTLLKI
jgi:hypothetical protein